MTNYQSQGVGFGVAFAQTAVAALKTTPSNPLINSAKVRLSHDPAFNPTPGSAIADLTPNECNYSGYTSGGIAVSLTVGLSLSPGCVGALTTALFTATSATPFVSDVAYGYWVDDGTNVILFEKFANAGQAAFAAPGNFLDLTVLVPMQLLQATS